MGHRGLNAARDHPVDLHEAPMFRSSTFARRSLFAAFLALSAVSAVSVAETAAIAASSPATAFVEGKTNKLRAILQEKAGAERDKKVEEEMKGVLDYEDMAKVALGAGTEKDFYKDRSKEELTEFTDTLRKLIEKNFKKSLTDTLDFDVTFTGEEAKGQDTLVKTLAKSKTDLKKPANKIDYQVRKKGSGYVIVDIITEDAPLVEKTYRKDFRREIEKNGFPSLMKKLKDKLAMA
jgi:phospholipid transport system substrate-binding protein